MINDDLISSSAQRLFADLADIQAVLAAKDTSWKDRLWAGIEKTGLDVAALPEDLGGAGIGLSDSLGILRAAGQMTLAAPLAACPPAQSAASRISKSVYMQGAQNGQAV